MLPPKYIILGVRFGTNMLPLILDYYRNSPKSLCSVVLYCVSTGKNILIPFIY